MKYSTAVLVALAVAEVTCNDLQVGTSNGRIVFNETVQANPAIWRQVQKISINASEHESISSVIVTDNRPEKDGDAEIVEGGEGQKNVTIELKSPTVFRGFDFHVTVYAAQDNIQHPFPMSKDVEVNTSAKPEDLDYMNTANKGIKKTGDESVLPPILTANESRLPRNTEQSTDPILQYVTDKSVANEATTVTSPVTEVETDGALKMNGSAKSASVTPLMNDEDKTAYEESKTILQGISTDNPIRDDVKILSTTEADDVVTKGDDVTTPKTHENMVMQNFDSISRELGQRVIFGIKKH